MTEYLTENQAALYLLMLTAGILLGVLFFGGLLLTVRRSLTSERPVLWVSISYLTRMAIAVIVFYHMARLGWAPALAGLAGFLLARLIFFRSLKRSSAHSKQKENYHETKS